MSKHQAQGAGQGGGGRGQEGQGQGRGGPGRAIRKIKKKYTSNTPGLKDDIFECGKAEHAVLFKKLQKAIANYIRMSGEKESAIVASIIEDMTTRGIPIPAAPPQIVNPIQPDPRPDPPKSRGDIHMAGRTKIDRQPQSSPCARSGPGICNHLGPMLHNKEGET